MQKCKTFHLRAFSLHVIAYCMWCMELKRVSSERRFAEVSVRAGSLARLPVWLSLELPTSRIPADILPPPLPSSCIGLPRLPLVHGLPLLPHGQSSPSPRVRLPRFPLHNLYVYGALPFHSILFPTCSTSLKIWIIPRTVLGKSAQEIYNFWGGGEVQK